MAPAQTHERTLLATTTREPFQPVRIYYRIPSVSVVTRVLKQLECTVPDKHQRTWSWLFHAEAASLEFGALGYDEVPEAIRPIVIGRIRLPKRGGLILETTSTARAIEAVRFFAPRFGPSVVAVRGRLVNQWFAVRDGHPEDLLASLDRNVTVIDPQKAEGEADADFAGITSVEDYERVAAERIRRKIERGDDVPLVEDFPLAPDEETPDFEHLAMTLQLRFIRAGEHWRGNTHLTLTAIIKRAVEEQMGERV